MKKTRWAVLAVTLAAVMLGVMAACDRGEPPLEVSPPVAPALIIDDVNHSIMLADEAHPQKPVVMRADPSTRTRHLDCGDFHIVSGMGWLAEYTSQEYLEVSSEDLGNGRHLERYFFNGRVLELEINDSSGPTPEQYQQFLDFYPTDPTENSLENHPDGRLMAEILARAQPAMMQIWEEHDPRGHDQYLGTDKDDRLPPLLLRPRWADYGCGMASTCALIMCRMLPHTNPACWICAAAVVVCIIMDMFGWW